LGQIRTGLALFYDTYNEFPNSVAGSAPANAGHTTDATEPADLVVGAVTLASTVRADAGPDAGFSTTGDLIYDTMVGTAQKYISRLPVAPNGGTTDPQARYYYRSCGSTNVEDYALLTQLERPALADAFWVVDYSTGTAQERAFAANFCTAT
jgi:hypothetical protein